MAIEIDYSGVDVAVTMVRGDDFIHTFRVGGKEEEEDPIEYWDLTGWDVRGQVRLKASSADPIATINVELADQGTLPGQFTIHIPDIDDDGLGTRLFPGGKECFGDVEFVNPDLNIRTYFRIAFDVVADVTREA